MTQFTMRDYLAVSENCRSRQPSSPISITDASPYLPLYKQYICTAKRCSPSLRRFLFENGGIKKFSSQKLVFNHNSSSREFLSTKNKHFFRIHLFVAHPIFISHNFGSSLIWMLFSLSLHPFHIFAVIIIDELSIFWHSLENWSE